MPAPTTANTAPATRWTRIVVGDASGLAFWSSIAAAPMSTATPTPTTTPTPTSTPTQLPNEVVINWIEPGDLAEEYVRVKNRTNETVEITGWTIKASESGRTYTFPFFYLDHNDAVRVWTKAGYSDGKDLYWGLTT